MDVLRRRPWSSHEGNVVSNKYVADDLLSTRNLVPDRLLSVSTGTKVGEQKLIAGIQFPGRGRRGIEDGSRRSQRMTQRSLSTLPPSWDTNLA